MMKLENCTKAELLWVLQKAREFPGGSHPIALALRELRQFKFTQRMARCDELVAISTDCRKQYHALMKPYDGLENTPMEIVDQALALLERAEKADREWNRLMAMDGEV